MMRTRANIVSVGNSATEYYRRITNVADGVNRNDAVNVGQLNAAMASGCLTDTDSQNFSCATGLIDGPGALHSIAIGQFSHVYGGDCVAIGLGATTLAPYTTAIGNAAEAQGAYASSLGYAANAYTPNATSIGGASHAGGDGATALGFNAYAYSDHTTALGANAMTSGVDSSVLGYGAQTIGTGSGAFGAYAAGNGQNALALGTSAVAGATYVADSRLNLQINTVGALAAGSSASALGNNSLALGMGAQAGALISTKQMSTGEVRQTYTTTDPVDDDIAIGGGAIAMTGQGTAIGTRASGWPRTRWRSAPTAWRSSPTPSRSAMTARWAAAR